MNELPLIFVGGLLGSSHCIGMCGPLALALGVTGDKLSSNLRRQLAFSIGRICTYGFFGATAAFAGLLLGNLSWLSHSIQGVLAVAGGTALVLLGLSTAGVLPRLNLSWTSPQPCTAALGLKSLLTSPKLAAAFLAGVFTGFIPCGLVYAFLAMAAGSGNVARGWLIMATFGFGTVPLLLITGCGGTLISVATRARVLQIAAWCVVVTGIISIARGAGHLDFRSESRGPTCPFCHSTNLDLLQH